MNEIRVRKARPIAAEITVPGDKSISHRAVIVAALANGPTVITGFLPSAECVSTVEACRALGVRIEFLSEGDSDEAWLPDEKSGVHGSTRIRVHGRSLRLAEPRGPVSCGSSGTALTLLLGVLAGQPWTAVLQADEYVSKPVLEQIMDPLLTMGVEIIPEWQWQHASITVEGNPPLQCRPAPYRVSNAQLASTLLLAGLFAAGKTTVLQSGIMSDHTERMLKHFQVKTLRRGLTVSVYGGQMPESRDFHVPGDISCAANWVVAAALQPGSELIVRGVGLNETRTGFLRVLVRMGARILEHVNSDASEPLGTLIVRGAPLRGTIIPREDLTELTEELPLLAVAAAMAEGNTVIDEAPEEAERLGRIAHNLRLMGVGVSSVAQGIEIKGSGGQPLQPGCVPSYGDRRIAMAFAVAGLFASGETIIENTGCVDAAYPDFEDELRRFQSREISEGHGTPVISSAPFRRRPSPRPAAREMSGKPDDKPSAPRHE